MCRHGRLGGGHLASPGLQNLRVLTGYYQRVVWKAGVHVHVHVLAVVACNTFTSCMCMYVQVTCACTCTRTGCMCMHVCMSTCYYVIACKVKYMYMCMYMHVTCTYKSATCTVPIPSSTLHSVFVNRVGNGVLFLP